MPAAALSKACWCPSPQGRDAGRHGAGPAGQRGTAGLWAQGRVLEAEGTPRGQKERPQKSGRPSATHHPGQIPCLWESASQRRFVFSFLVALWGHISWINGFIHKHPLLTSWINFECWRSCLQLISSDQSSSWVLSMISPWKSWLKKCLMNTKWQVGRLIVFIPLRSTVNG